jgi:hypothetical protein
MRVQKKKKMAVYLFIWENFSWILRVFNYARSSGTHPTYKMRPHIFAPSYIMRIHDVGPRHGRNLFSRLRTSGMWRYILWHDAWKPELWSHSGSPLVANGSVSTFPWQQTFSMVTGSLYKEPCKEERFRRKGAVIREFSSVQESSAVEC